VDNKPERAWKEAVVAQFHTPPRFLSVGAADIHGNLKIVRFTVDTQAIPPSPRIKSRHENVRANKRKKAICSSRGSNQEREGKDTKKGATEGEN
jgi:hypothetical protein